MKRAAALALVAALALSGCGRLAHREPSAPAASPSPTSSAVPLGLDDIQSQLEQVDTAVGESTADLADGDEAEGNE